MANEDKGYHAGPEQANPVTGDIDFSEIFQSGVLREKIEGLRKVIEENQKGQDGQQKSNYNPKLDYKG